MTGKTDRTKARKKAELMAAGVTFAPVPFFVTCGALAKWIQGDTWSEDWWGIMLAFNFGIPIACGILYVVYLAWLDLSDRFYARLTNDYSSERTPDRIGSDYGNY
jgi:hypothetical protein